MKLCIVGTGAAGWMAANYFVIRNNIEEVIIIGSPEILPIGVGESNTLLLNTFHSQIGCTLKDFVRESDASIKYGVFYKNWCDEDFLHNFKGEVPWDYLGIPLKTYLASLSKRPKGKKFHDYYAKDLMKVINDNNIFLGVDEYPISWHFDAAKYINYLSNRIKSDKLLTINQTVVGCLFDGDRIKSLKLQDGSEIESDYFIFATGSDSIFEDQLKIKYNSLSDVLLTNKAYVYPLEYTDKRAQFHPYTVAKTMKYGWRWITPTYSRIGTGYVFSDSHVSLEDARQEFLEDIGDNTITPRLVSFQPKYAEKTFHSNYCTIGMANGFLEPLDAPGISLTIDVLYRLKNLFIQNHYFNGQEAYRHCVDMQNKNVSYSYKFWASFILAQYKTCRRNDTDFWKDHKKVKWNFYENIMQRLNSETGSYIVNADMFYHTLSARRFEWDESFDLPYFKMPSVQNEQKIHHLDYIQTFHGLGA